MSTDKHTPMYNKGNISNISIYSNRFSQHCCPYISIDQKRKRYESPPT